MDLCGLTQTRSIYSARRLIIAFQTENLAVQYSARSFPKASAVGLSTSFSGKDITVTITPVEVVTPTMTQSPRMPFQKRNLLSRWIPTKLRQVARSMNTLILAWSTFFLQRCESLNKPTHLQLQHFRESAVR